MYVVFTFLNLIPTPKVDNISGFIPIRYLWNMLDNTNTFCDKYVFFTLILLYRYSEIQSLLPIVVT